MRNSFVNKIKLSVVCTLCFPSITKSQTLIMNEVSNGPAGNQEYVEFVVVSDTVTYNCSSPTPPCIDIRGWIFDDNSGYHGTSGIAVGAVRFSNDVLWSCVPVGTIIVIYNNGDPNPAMPPDDLSLADSNCTIIAPLNSLLFESNATTPGAVACSYPIAGWTPGGNWVNTLLANVGDCARIVNLAGCEVFSVCWSTDNLNNLIYFNSGGSGTQNVWYFNGVDPTIQSNWSEGITAPTPGNQTPGAPNNAANAAYIAQFNNGCMPITPINVTATAVNAGCTCNGTATATATGSIPGYTYTWYNGAFAPIGQTTATAIGLCAGIYNVIAISSIGCADTATVTITAPATATVTVNSQSICSGSTTTLTATPSITGGTYLWSPGGQTTQTISINPALTTTYTVTYTLALCSSTGTGIVTVIPLPTIIVNSPTICNGANATLTATGGTTYLWNTGSTANFLSITPAATTSYTVTGTSLGCTSTAISIVTVDSLLTLAIAGLAATCNGTCDGQTIVIPSGGTSPYSYLWSSGCSGAACNSLCAASYTVTVTDALGCVADTNTIVTEPTLLTASINSSTPTNCNGVCDGTATAAVAGGTIGGGYSYLWNTIPIQTTTTAIGLCAGSYIFTATDANGCVATTTVTITEPTMVVIAPIASVVICPGGSITLTAITTGGNGGPYNYTWSPATGLSSTTIANPVASPSATTVYSVAATDNNGCPAATVYVTVTINSPLTVIVAGIDSICPGTFTTISANASLGSGGPYTYTWSPTVPASGSVSPAVTTTYTVTVSDGCSPNATATVTVTVLPLPAVIFNANVISGCAPLCVNFFDASTVTTGSVINSWNWDFGDDGIDITSNPTHCYQNDGLYSVSLTVSTNFGCTNSFIQNNYITVFPLPNAEFSSNLTVTDILNATISFNNQSSGASIWQWNFGDLATSNQSDPTHTYENEGQYSVLLVAISDYGCVDSVMHFIEINGGFTFYAPNAFTPNDDFSNTIFLPKGIGWNPEKYELMIFDRWGNLCFETTDMNKGWNGKANYGSEVAQQDVFVWKVVLTDVFDKKHKYIGSVTIVK